MFKVICIDSRNPGNPDYNGPDPVEGDILTVTWEGDYCGIHSYEFAEFENPETLYLFSAWRFARISSIDETELVNEKETVNA